jgi:aldehyde dehydrogenase (NAD(P)+)
LISINPADEQEITSVQSAGQEDIDRAVQAARRAFGPWRELSGSQRADLLFKLCALIEQHREVLATIESWDSGKPFTASRDEDISELVSVLKYYAGWADKIHGTVIVSDMTKLAYTMREPVGVCGQIIPWNYPLGMAAWK